MKAVFHALFDPSATLSIGSLALWCYVRDYSFAASAGDTVRIQAIVDDGEIYSYLRLFDDIKQNDPEAWGSLTYKVIDVLAASS